MNATRLKCMQEGESPSKVRDGVLAHPVHEQVLAGLVRLVHLEHVLGEVPGGSFGIAAVGHEERAQVWVTVAVVELAPVTHPMRGGRPAAAHPHAAPRAHAGAAVRRVQAVVRAVQL